MSSNDSEYEPSSEPLSSPTGPNERDSVSLKEMGVFSDVFEDNEQSDTDSLDSQLEELDQGASSLSDGEDSEDPEWLPVKDLRLAISHSSRGDAVSCTIFSSLL